MCVATSTPDYEFAPWSSFGPKIDAILPGEYIVSADNRGDGMVHMEQQTGAAPMLAGIMALVIGFEGLNANGAAVETVYARVKANQLHDILKDVPKGTKNVFQTNGMNHPNRGTEYPYAIADAKPADGEDGATTTITSKSPAAWSLDASNETVC